MRNKPEYKRHAVVLTLAVASLTIFAAPSLTPSGLASAQTTAPSWNITGSLNTARAGHTATLLPNGKVLVAGGSSQDQRAELYDPATGTWSYTGSLNTNRGGHTATLLPNSKVLVAGGFSSDHRSSLNSAELYDPATGTWSTTGSLNRSRGEHTATLLQNGKVLAAGGSDFQCPLDCNNTVLRSAELYDPNTGAWSLTGPLVASDAFGPGREGHTATLLQNGTVLVAGGIDPGDFGVFSTELYDPTTGTWSVSGTANDERIGHTATLLPDGDVLIAGACNSGIFCGSGSSRNSSAELYNPATETWNVTGGLTTPRFFHAATLLANGRVLIAGGEHINFASGTEVFLNSAEIYDRATGNWSATANLNGPRLFYTATLLPNGKVLVVGGRAGTNTGPLLSAELYDSGSSSIPNSIDDPQFFVTQHYRDFLSREPDPAGLAFWVNEITSCRADAHCVEGKRINVSASFFLSIEFQESGYLVYRFYKSAFGNLPGAPIPVRFSDFIPDSQQIGQGVIVNQAGWQTVLENNKQAYALTFVQRSQFTSLYQTSMSPTALVDALFANAGVIPTSTDRAAAINEFGGAATTAEVAARSRALRRVAENSTLAQQEFNRAFVLMQYLGYLRRNPNDAPDGHFTGYNFWLNKLNQFNGNFIQAEMVKAFIVSAEYRQRFSLP